VSQGLRTKLLIGSLITITSISWGNSLEIYFKAIVAQLLIDHAWEKTIKGHSQPPWPWADTKPLAKMRDEKSGNSYIILSGGKGNALAFGPTHIEGTQKPGDLGTSVIAGHRDTHFSFLQTSKKGDQINIQSIGGIWTQYEITDLSIHDTRQSNIWTIDSELDQLLLVTCYPFDTINPGGPLRLVVTLNQVVDFNSISPSVLGPENRLISSLK